MPAEIKFTNFGIPYLVEFANISIRSSTSKKKIENAKKPSPKKAPSPPVRCPTCGHLPSHQLSPADVNETPAKSPRPGGLYIRFGASTDAAPTKISERRLAKLRWTIEEAVTKAGMLKPAVDESGNAIDSQSSDGSETVRSTSTDSSKKALFKGTYGQVKQALKEAGLTTTACSENGFEHATRLGALFVVNSGGSKTEELELTKLTLWG